MFGKKNSTDFNFHLGDKLRDTITGFIGVVICRSQWIHSCNVYTLQPQSIKDGKPSEKAYFDEPALELITEKTVTESRLTGGPERIAHRANR